MKTVLKITPIGNSHGIRIPAAVLRRYGIGDAIVMEQRSDGIFLRPTGSAVAKLSWEETASEMAAASESWDDWDTTSADGLTEIPWDPSPTRRVAEPGVSYTAGRKKKKS